MKKKNQNFNLHFKTHEDKKSTISEQFRNIRTNLEFVSPYKKNKARIIQVTSPGPSEGKSTISLNLAISFTDLNKKVLLVDADMRKPSIHKAFQIPNKMGLSNLLCTDSSFREAIYYPDIPRLAVITSGIKPLNPSELLSTEQFEEFLASVQEQFDFIIIDTPPIGVVVDAQIISSKIDGTILVLREKVTKKVLIKRSIEALDNAGAAILGTIYNGSSEKDSEYYYYG